MTAKRILITGASGCIGHYFTEQLIQKTKHELFILVRNPTKLRFDAGARPGVHILEADLRQIEQFTELLGTIQVAILAATAWGGLEESYEINVTKTLALIQALSPKLCEQVLYFSTESILNQSNQLMPEAGKLGTEYIQTKYACFQELEKLSKTADIPPITAVFPTFVFGGDKHKPYSHLTSGFQDVLNWLGLIRFFTADASFHFMHGYDIAQVVCYLVEHPQEVETIAGIEQAVSSKTQPRKIILGNPAMTLDETIREACTYFRKQIYFQFPLKIGLAEFFIRIFRIQVGSWDRFCMQYRHFVHQNPVSPRMLGLVPYAETLTDILKIYRFGKSKQRKQQ